MSNTQIFHQSSTGALKAKYETATGTHENFYAEGDVSEAKQFVKEQREIGRNTKSHYQHMAEIPMIIVLELQTKWGMDIMGPDFMANPANVTRLKYILKTEYPDLLTMT